MQEILFKILGEFEVELMNLVGEEFAPKQEGGSDERKRLLGLISKTWEFKSKAVEDLCMLIAHPPKVTRFEVIDNSKNAAIVGRAYVKMDGSIELSYQDDDRTLKVFIGDRLADQASGQSSGSPLTARSPMS